MRRHILHAVDGKLYFSGKQLFLYFTDKNAFVSHFMQRRMRHPISFRLNDAKRKRIEGIRLLQSVAHGARLCQRKL